MSDNCLSGSCCRILEFAEMKAFESNSKALSAGVVRAETIIEDLRCAKKTNSVCSSMRIRFFERGQTIVYENEQYNNFFVLVSGGIIVRKSSVEGRQVTVARIRPGTGCSLNVGCLLRGLQFPAELVAETDLVLGVVPKINFMQCISESCQFRDYVFGDFGRQMNDLVEFVSEMVFESIDLKILKWILKSSDENDVVSVTHQQLADEIGSVREVVSRELKRLREKGFIKLGRGKLRILDRRGLSALAGLDSS